MIQFNVCSDMINACNDLIDYYGEREGRNRHLQNHNMVCWTKYK